MSERFREPEPSGQKEIPPQEQEEILAPSEKDSNAKKSGKKISRRGFLRGAIGAVAVAATGSLVAGEKEKKDQSGQIQEMEAMRRRDFEYIKGIIGRSKMEEKLDYLAKEYGDASEKVFWDARRTIKLVKEIEKDNRPEVFVDRDSPYIAVKVSPLSYARQRWTDLTKEEKLKKSGIPEVRGFNRINEIFNNEDADWKGDSDKKVRDEVRRRYPLQWLASTKEIAYHDEDKNMTEEYGMRGWRGGDARGGFLHLEKGEINLYKRNSYYLPDMIKDIDHELAHHNDWASSTLLSEPQRIEFLCDATRAFKSTKHFFSRYVESIKNKDKQKEAYFKVTEYWAVAVEQYMANGPEKYRKTNPTEAELVEKWFNITNDIKK